MRVTDKVSIDKSILINVLQSAGESFREPYTEAHNADGEVVITLTSDIEGELLCERGDESRPVRTIQLTHRHSPLFIPQEVKEVRLNWEVLYPKTQWAVYALTKSTTCYFGGFRDNLDRDAVRVGLCENKHKIIDVSEFTPNAAVAEFLRLSREHEMVRLYGVALVARLVVVSGTQVVISGTQDIVKHLFICIY